MHTRISSLFKVLVAVVALGCTDARAFSLLGPFTTWQVNGLAYGFGGDIGGPMNLREGFRWNVPLITYGFDKSFLDYFGAEGAHAIDEAFAYFDDLPDASKMSPDLAEFSTSTMRENFEAGTLGLYDIKTVAMTMIMEELGFADPIRYVFTLRSRTVEQAGGVQWTNYVTIMRNFDPVTLMPSRYVNNTLYTYEIREFPAPFAHADALEIVRFGNDIETIPVATGTGRIQLLDGTSDSGPAGTFLPGVFRVGLTRDDVGGIRFLYHKDNYAVEGLLSTVVPGAAVRGGWIPFTTVTNQTNITVTNVVVGGTNGVLVGVRGGRNKLNFKRVFFDGIIGNTFTPITNSYNDVVLSTNGVLTVQGVQRGILQPDFIFVAQDNGVVANLIPALLLRTDTTGWIDNDALNGLDETDESNGPGIIQPPVQISFSDQLPYFYNTTSSSFLDEFPNEDSGFGSGMWGSFDGSTNPPVIYPVYQLIRIQDLRRQILNSNN